MNDIDLTWYTNNSNAYNNWYKVACYANYDTHSYLFVLSKDNKTLDYKYTATSDRRTNNKVVDDLFNTVLK
jgi:hypothetical protein